MKAAFHTLGCKVNSYETQAILEQFKGMAFDVVDFTEKADVYVINTCSVTQMAEHKSRQLIHRARKLNQDAVVVATGCYAQRVGEQLLKDDSIDIVVGNNRKSEIAKIVADFIEDREAAAAVIAADDHETDPEKVKTDKSRNAVVDDLMHCSDYESQTITSHGENIRAYVKIQDGCNRFCSYCIIPYVRGRSRCRRPEEVIEEVRSLAANGYKEIVLTGIDISMYDDMISLIEAIQNIEGIERIRLGSLEVSVITEDFIRRFAACSKACPQFHLSLQSGCDATLKRMNRHYTPEEYASKVEIIRKYFETPGITTDVIVGFAGETEQDFEESHEFVKRMAFTQTHVFKFSRRAGTRADRMPDQVPEKIKTARSARLMKTADNIKYEFEKSLIGSVRTVLFEESTVTLDGRNVQIGFTPEYVKIAVESDDNLINTVASVKLDGWAETENGRIMTGRIV